MSISILVIIGFFDLPVICQPCNTNGFNTINIGHVGYATRNSKSNGRISKKNFFIKTNRDNSYNINRARIKRGEEVVLLDKLLHNVIVPRTRKCLFKGVWCRNVLCLQRSRSTHSSKVMESLSRLVCQ